MANKTTFEKRNINFFEALQRHERDEERPEKRSFLFPVLALCSALALGGMSYLFYQQDQMLDVEIASLQTYVNSEQNVSAFADKAQLRKDIVFLSSYNETCKIHIEYLRSANRLDSVSFETVESRMPENTRILEYKFENSALSVLCETTDKSAPSRFAQDLTELGKFPQVTYDGFAAVSDVESTYTFTIICKLWL